MGYQPLREPELIDAYLLAVGKALYIASSFEKECQWVLRILKLVAKYETDPDLDTFEAFANALKDSLLRQTLRGLAAFDGGSENELATLAAGKDARNFIAHEAAALGHLTNIGCKQITDSIASLREQMESLIAADNLVSKWVYEIEEKEPAPQSIQQAYPTLVRSWVFKGVAA